MASTVPTAAEFLQEFAGYCLTTDTSHEMAIWLYGLPGSGKSTFLAGLQAILGDRAGLLGLADIERSRFGLSQLPGKTLVVSTEQPSAYLGSTHILNAIISGEPITVDIKYKDPIAIIPRAKIAWAMNELPRVAGANNGLFRRVRVVEFPALPEADRDPRVKEGVKLEGAGILNWALKGLARLRERGKFEFPERVVEATCQFREMNDEPALFVEECCVTGSDHKLRANVLYVAYKSWCHQNGFQAESITRVAADWKRLGFEKSKSHGYVTYHGVGLRPNHGGGRV